MASVSVQVPDDLMAKLEIDGARAERQLPLEAAFSLCQRGEMSTSQAARLAGLTYTQFLEAAAHAKVELFTFNENELNEELTRGSAMKS